MWNAAEEVAAALEHALGGLAESVTGAALGWLAVGVLLHLANQVLRGRGWHAVVRAATDETPSLRRRDTILAWIAGAGASGVASARGGDAVRVLLLRRKVPRDGCPLLAGTLVAESAGEVLIGAPDARRRARRGRGSRDRRRQHERGARGLLAAGLLLVGGLVLAGRRIPAVRRTCARVNRGCVVLRQPVTYAREVLPWQLASRGCRFASVLCFLAAFGLPATPVAVLLVVAAQGGGRLLPFAPASVTAGAAMLAAAFEPVTGSTVAAADVAAFFVGTSTVLTVVGIASALLICSRTVPWPQLTDALRVGRTQPARSGPRRSASTPERREPAAQVPANVGRSDGAGALERMAGRSRAVPSAHPRC
jgi:uncharacterized membrane protein YbhN (UPF0104 family)